MLVLILKFECMSVCPLFCAVSYIQWGIYISNVNSVIYIYLQRYRCATISISLPEIVPIINLVHLSASPTFSAYGRYAAIVALTRPLSAPSISEILVSFED